MSMRACIPWAVADRRSLWPVGIGFCCLALLATLVTPVRGDLERRGWLGVYTEPVSELPQIMSAAGGPEALRGATSALRVSVVFPDSPAEAGGLQEGDLIIAVADSVFACPAAEARRIFKRNLDARAAGEACPLRVIRDAVDRTLRLDDAPAPAHLATLFWRSPREAADSLSHGARLTATLDKAQRVLDLPIVLGLRPEDRWAPAPPNDRIYPPQLFPIDSTAALTWALAEAHGVRTETEDLLDRLARCHRTADPFRLRCMTYVHRDPFRLEAVSRHIVRSLSGAGHTALLLARTAPLWTPQHGIEHSAATRLVAPPNAAASGETGAERVAALLEQITTTLAAAAHWHAEAFGDLRAAERDFLSEERWNLSDAFAGEVYIHFDSDRERFGKNKRILDLAQRVDYPALLEAALRLSLLTDPEWARAAAARLREAFADSLDREILLERDTPFGRILIGGTDRNWYRDLDTAFILDLGGDDFYTGACGGSQGWELPLSICIDLCGDDAYESTRPAAQGAGCLGIGGLLDLEGNDSYIGVRWCQGAAYLGIGWLHDLAGDDTYRGRSFCQGIGLCGLGLLRDEAGHDRYDGDAQVQGVGLARGIGGLLDARGDDHYYAKGLYPTGYGDAGIFDAWSQGCGMGFRTLASGGLGLLSDGGGRDVMEAGNFSQGGGYYYGYGILAAGGVEDDTYIGSRYNQGFCAHQALGVFLEAGGDDAYTTRQGVAQGLAWDECATLFIDSGGDDHYQGGSFFSQGASAHNSFCFFIDRGGADRYDYPPGPARAGGNSYHGGTSFSLFVDAGGDRDRYAHADFHNDAFRTAPEHGFFLDLEGGWERVWRKRPWEAVAGRPGN
ncbi:MAG: hypothetical protein GF330_01265 [Candidatus Eisenbacteria bacterium]|nr:hypothetical protein [Candidatus Eisenbacteria bacterium]